MRTLVDTSVWIDHLHRPDKSLIHLLENDEVFIHPAVIGELACGTLKRRAETLASLRLLPMAPEADLDETLQMIENLELYGTGLSWVDVQLLASARLADAVLYTHEKRLARLFSASRS